jgi:hypothetical protein
MLLNIATKENNVSLSNKENYLSSLQNPIQDMITIQFRIFNEYDKTMNEMYVNTHSQDTFNIYMMGIESIFHIFEYLLLYTKNMDLSYSSCQTAIYLYIEFINQIMDESNTYLKLNISDAVLFIYKNTIFRVNSSHCKYDPQNITIREKEIYDTLQMNCNSIKKLIQHIYHRTKKNDENESMNYLSENMDSIHSILTTMISIKDNGTHSLLEDYHCLYYILQQLDEHSLSISSYLECVQHFCKNIKKKNDMTLSKLMHKFHQNISNMENPSIVQCIELLA